MFQSFGSAFTIQSQKLRQFVRREASGWYQPKNEKRRGLINIPPDGIMIEQCSTAKRPMDCTQRSLAHPLQVTASRLQTRQMKSDSNSMPLHWGAAVITIIICGALVGFLIWVQPVPRALLEVEAGLMFGALPLIANRLIPILWSNSMGGGDLMWLGRTMALLLTAQFGLMAYIGATEGLAVGPLPDFAIAYRCGLCIGVLLGTIWWFVGLLEKERS